jgi:hypothetical protein
MEFLSVIEAAGLVKKVVWMKATSSQITRGTQGNWWVLISFSCKHGGHGKLKPPCPLAIQLATHKIQKIWNIKEGEKN